MKRTIVLLATLLLSFGLINAADQVSIAPYVGGSPVGPTDTIWTGQAASIHIVAQHDTPMGGLSLGVEISSPDGATWTWGTPKVDTSSWAGKFSLTGALVTEFDADGNLPDLLLFGGATIVTIAAGTNYHTYEGIAGPNEAVGVGRNLCFDSMFVPPAGNFVFVDEFGGAFTPAWAHGDQPVCWVTSKQPNACPEYVLGATEANVSHCGPAATINFSATDLEGDAISYALSGTTGTGTAVVNPGSVSYTPGPGEVGDITVTVIIGDAFNGPCNPQDFVFHSTNNAPTIGCGLALLKVGKGGEFNKNDFTSGDPDGCDVLSYSIVSFVDAALNPPLNAPSFDGSTFTWQTDNSEVGIWTGVVEVSDGFATAQCSFQVEVLATEPYFVGIECATGILSGHFVDIDLVMDGGSEAMGGFDFLIAYDPTVLTFTEAHLGADLAQCGWEYFTYRYGTHGNCGNACPSGELRIVGIAETNNGPYHPDALCIGAAQSGGVLATLTFYVSDNLLYGGMCVPLNFLWFDCGDNTVSVFSGDTLAIADLVFPAGANTDDPGEAYPIPGGFPTMYGAPDVCLVGDKVRPIRFLNLQNGCVCILHPDDYDDRGDLNVNGVKNEIADAVMFTNFFISGVNAFGSHIDASIAASDVNADGTALSVADLVYLVRVIIGDALPYPKPAPNASASFTMQGDLVQYNSNVDLGGALFIFNGTSAPQLLVDGMEMKYGVDNGQLRVLVYSLEGNSIPADDAAILNVPGGQLVGVEVADYNGAMMDASYNNLPTQFELAQNYPNPFNPSTTIALNLPVASEWTISIYNVAGQLVKTYSGYNEAGRVDVVWDGSDASGAKVASGIYFYKGAANNYSSTKKMVLMK